MPLSLQRLQHCRMDMPPPVSTLEDLADGDVSHAAVITAVHSLDVFSVCIEVLVSHTPYFADDGSVTKKARNAPEKPVAVVLDIEGTVAPISFVTETLFPYARARVKDHLTDTFNTPETQADIELLRQQVIIILFLILKKGITRHGAGSMSGRCCGLT